MASDKKIILIFTNCDGKALTTASTPAIAKIRDKGAMFTNMAKSCGKSSDIKAIAAAGAEAGETLWDAAKAQNYNVAGLNDGFDMCVLDAGASVEDVEKVLAQAQEVADRSTLIALVANGALFFAGPGIAKGKVIDDEICPCAVAPTAAYVANFPVPAQCTGPVAYAALKDINYKLGEIKKLQESITNMEAAMERKSRQPWDKHDCA